MSHDVRHYNTVPRKGWNCSRRVAITPPKHSPSNGDAGDTGAPKLGSHGFGRIAGYPEVGNLSTTNSNVELGSPVAWWILKSDFSWFATLDTFRTFAA